MRTSVHDDPFGEGCNPLGVELALESRTRSRPLARQLGASVYLKQLWCGYGVVLCRVAVTPVLWRG